MVTSGGGKGARSVFELGEQAGDVRTHLATVHDHVDGAVIEQELAALETFGKTFTHGLLDDTRSGESDECAWLGNVDVAEPVPPRFWPSATARTTPPACERRRLPRTI